MTKDINLKSLDRWTYKTFYNTKLSIRGWNLEYNPIEGMVYWVKDKGKLEATPFYESDVEMSIMYLDISNHRYNYIKTVNLQNWYTQIKCGHKSTSQFLVHYLSIIDKILEDEKILTFYYNS